MMIRHRIYVDEVGNHDMKHADEPNHRFFSLTGVIVSSSDMLQTIQPEMDELKRRFFQTDPDEPVIFHRKEMVNRRWPFGVLRDEQILREWNDELLSALSRWPYTVISVVLDKMAHRDQYRVWTYHPYHYCMAIMLERYVRFLEDRELRGDVMFEGRGGKEDLKLKDSYSRLYREGTQYVAAERWQNVLSSKEIKVKPKKANIAGLQLADLVAHPSRREMLIECRLVDDDRSTFGDQICEILTRTKYYRSSSSGTIWGYGKKKLP